MDVDVEAKRIMALSISKLYSSRAQRGGMGLHRSLLLSMVMRSARDIYHCAMRDREEQTVQCAQEQPATEEPMETCDEQDGITDSPLSSTQETQATTGENQPRKLKEEDKENRNPTRPDRHSRKRRGKTAVEPDFLPLKRARMESGEERHGVQSAALRSSNGNCYRLVDTLTSIPLSCAIAAF